MNRSSDEHLGRHVRELEESLLEPQVRKSQTLADLLADEFVEFGGSGRIYTKSELVDTLREEFPSNRTASDFKLTDLSENVALLTYRSLLEGEPPVNTLRSSIWRRTDDGWK